MINKFKDFLKNLSRKRQDDSSDQDEDFDQEISDEQVPDDEAPEEEIPAKPSWREKFSFRKKKEETPADSDEPLYATDEEDLTGDIPLPVEEENRPSWKERFKSPFRKKEQSFSEEDATGEKSLDDNSEDAPSWKDKIALSAVRDKLGRINVREWKLPDRMKSKKGDNLLLLSPSLSKSVERVLSREARENIHQVFLVVIICSFTYGLGKITALSLRGAPNLDSARDYTVNIKVDDAFRPGTLAQVRSINVFRTNTGLGGPKKKAADTKCEVAQQASNLPIKLVNTVVLQDQIKSLASVQVRGDRDLQELRVGDQISNLAKIFKINRLEILVKNLENGICEAIVSEKLRESRSPISVMSPAASREFVANKKLPGIENQGNKFMISKKLLDEKMKDIAAILTQARAIKIQNPDGTMAFKLTELDPEGIFPYLGLQDQDIITSINGKPIYDMNEVMGLFARIKNVDKLQLGIKREGSETVLDYNIKK